MNINGVYGNGISKIPEKTTDIVSKEVNSTTIEKSVLEAITTISDTEAATYQEKQLKQVENDPKEDTEEISEEEKWKNNADRMSEEDYQELTDEGITLEEYSIESLDRALVRIKTQKAMKTESIEGQKEQIKEERENIKKISNTSGATKEIVDKLIEADLPVTEANIAKIANAMEMASATTQISDVAMNYLIKNNLEPTINNIYKAQYSGNYSNKSNVSEDTWNGLLEKVNEIISSAGLEVNVENQNNAKWLLNHQLPLTENTLWSLSDLKLINSNAGESVLDKAVEALAEGLSPESASLGIVETKRVEQIIATLQNVSDEAIELAVQACQGGEAKSIDKISCQDLEKAQKLVDEKADSEATIVKQTVEDTSSEEIDIQTITVRRQLEEIRLKMTVEAGQQLVKQGIQLDTDGLSKIVEGLKEIEDQYYRNLLQERDGTVTPENIETLKDSLQGIKELKSMPSYILGSTLTTRSIETVTGLLEAGTECKQSLARANESYEALMTSPRSDMGDSIKKAFRNVDAILEDMNLETTKANERAVRILGYNQTEITEENIQQVKSYDEQVNHLMKNLHPAVTVELIKKGINPLNVPVEDLNQQINEIKSEIGVSEEEKYSKYLWKLEKEQGITADEKKSFIGIYRLLNTVEKTDGAAVGSVLKADQEVTMANLLTAVRTAKSGGISAAVDDTFGALEQLTFSRESITDQIGAAFAGGSNTSDSSQTNERSANMEDKFNYINSLLQNVIEEITPSKLKAVGKTEDIMNMSVEKLQEDILAAPDNAAIEQQYWTVKTENYQNTIKQADNALSFLQDFNIPSSIQNIQAAKDVLSTDQTFYKQWKNVLEKESEKSSVVADAIKGQLGVGTETMSERLVESCVDSKIMASEYEKIEESVNSLLDRFYEDPEITTQDISMLQRISNGMSFLQKMASRESYEIPISVGDNITNVNVTIVRNTQESGKIDINVVSETLGKVSVGFSVKDQALKGLITCDNRLGLEAMQAESENLKETITEMGLEVKQINYGIENKNTDIYRFKNPNLIETMNSQNSDNASIDVEHAEDETIGKEEAVSTDTLYTLAKKLLIQIKTIEIKYM